MMETMAGGGMAGMSGAESMQMAGVVPFTSGSFGLQEATVIPAEPSIAEQIEDVEYFLDWLDEIKDEIDEGTWLNLSNSLEEMLEALQANQ
ncbi:MAG: hypothetical protein ACYTFK_12485 [Planctomycetota bacterium]|jgi:hypothetical protein